MKPAPDATAVAAGNLLLERPSRPPSGAGDRSGGKFEAGGIFYSFMDFGFPAGMKFMQNRI
jgi:hypothetical protein